MRKSVTGVSQILGSLMLLIISAFTLNAQSKISGTVTNSSSGLPLTGVTVAAKGSKVATQTNGSGVYTIQVPAGATALLFTSVGFATQEMTIGGRTTIDVGLTENNSRLNDVVIVADVVADVDLGVLVVEREDVRCREKVGIARTRDRLDEGAERRDRDAGPEEVLRAFDARAFHAEREALKAKTDLAAKVKAAAAG